jgi:acyl carrier protein
MTKSDEFLAWCGNLFNEPPETLTMETPREEIPGWDSMGTLLLMADLDEIHGIQLSEAELEELKTLQDIRNLIEARGSAGP